MSCATRSSADREKRTKPTVRIPIVRRGAPRACGSSSATPGSGRARAPASGPGWRAWPPGASAARWPSRSSPMPASTHSTRDSATKTSDDVLSFPSEDQSRAWHVAPRTSHLAPRSSWRHRHLHHDCPPPGTRRRHSYAAELKVLALHGLLHLWLRSRPPERRRPDGARRASLARAGGLRTGP
jgi:hypothetical protein